jgi:hypothetical protein
VSPRVVSLLVALRDHGGRCCTPPVFVCEGAPEVGGHGWALLYAPPAFVCEWARGVALYVLGDASTDLVGDESGSEKNDARGAWWSTGERPLFRAPAEHLLAFPFLYDAMTGQQ